VGVPSSRNAHKQGGGWDFAYFATSKGTCCPKLLVRDSWSDNWEKSMLHQVVLCLVKSKAYTLVDNAALFLTVDSHVIMRHYLFEERPD